MARPYLESQADGAEDPQTRRVYQSAVYLMDILDRVPVHVIPCIEGRLAERRQLRRRQLLRLDPPGGVELHAGLAVTGPGLGLDHPPPGPGGGGRRAPRHPRGHEPGRADPGRVHRPAATSSPRPARRSRASPTGTRGALPASNPRPPGASRTHDALCRFAPRDRCGGRRDRHLRRARPSGGAGTADRVEWARLHDDARGIAAALQARGVGPGVHVGILGPTTRAAGHHDPGDLPGRRHGGLAAAADAARIDRGVRRADPTAHRQRRRRARGRRPRPRAVPRPATGRRAASCCSTSSYARARAAAPGRGRDRPTTPSASTILQFTSGSTAAPKGVMLPDRCVGANIDAIIAGAQITPRRPRGVVAPALPRHGAHRVADDADAARASSWCSVRRRTSSPRRRPGWSGSPSTAARSPRAPTSPTRSRRARLRRAGALDLSSWRLALNGAETVDPSAVEAFCAAAAPFGFDAARRVPGVRHGRSDARR